MGFLTTAIMMFSFWVLLSGYFDAFHLVTGAISSLIVAWLSHDLLTGRHPDIGLGISRTVRFVRYIPWLMWEVIKANIDVVYRTLHPSMPINPCFVCFKNKLNEDVGITILANSITLTPGTVTVEADEDEFLIHAISDEAADSMTEGTMARKVLTIETGRRDV